MSSSDYRAGPTRSESLAISWRRSRMILIKSSISTLPLPGPAIAIDDGGVGGGGEGGEEGGTSGAAFRVEDVADVRSVFAQNLDHHSGSPV